MPKETVRIRRAPKYLSFLLVFASVGFIAALVVYFNIPEADRSAASILGFLVGYFSAAGAVFGIILALIVDGVSRLRSKTVVAERSR